MPFQMKQNKLIFSVLQPSPDIDNKTVSGAKVDETTAFTAKSARVAHEPPPPKHVAAHSINRINQPK